MQISYEMGLRRQFRYYSRCVYQSPHSEYYHKKRLQIAQQIQESEPLQGALADYFFAHWYDTASEAKGLLAEFSGKLPTHIVDNFWEYVNQGEHLPSISPLATKFSVLVSPSMNVPSFKVYVGRDDARQIAEQVKKGLLSAQENGDITMIDRITDDYLAHCLVCQDRMGFMLTWFALAKVGWVFDERWQSHKVKLEQLGE